MFFNLVIFLVILLAIAWGVTICTMGDMGIEPESSLAKAWVYGPVIVFEAIINGVRRVGGKKKED